MKSRIILRHFINDFWFVSSDVIQRSIESSIWITFKIKHPILEIGSGDGEISKLVFSKLKYIDVGIDVDANAIKRAKKCKLYKKVVCADCAKLPFESNSYKTVIANSTLEHIDNLKPSIKEIYRVLNKDGVFIFSVPLIDFRADILKNYGKEKLNSLNKRLHHVNYYGVNEWKHMLKKAGFEKVETKGYFSEEIMRVWYKLFNFSTLKIGNSELWSLVKKYFEKSGIVKGFFKFILRKYVSSVVCKNTKKGKDLMMFFIAYKN